MDLMRPSPSPLFLVAGGPLQHARTKWLASKRPALLVAFFDDWSAARVGPRNIPFSHLANSSLPVASPAIEFHFLLVFSACCLRGLFTLYESLLTLLGLGL